MHLSVSSICPLFIGLSISLSVSLSFLLYINIHICPFIYKYLNMPIYLSVSCLSRYLFIFMSFYIHTHTYKCVSVEAPDPLFRSRSQYNHFDEAICFQFRFNSVYYNSYSLLWHAVCVLLFKNACTRNGPGYHRLTVREIERRSAGLLDENSKTTSSSASCFVLL